MTDAPASSPKAESWADSLLTSGSEALLGAIRNYIGPVRTPYDKRDLVESLEAFLRRAETQESLIALLDDFDARIVGSCLLLGPASEHVLRDLFAGELPLFELGVRIANLFDRLILYRYSQGGRRLVAVNPILADRLAEVALDPALLFSQTTGAPEEGGEAPEEDDASQAAAACDATIVVGFFSFLFHFPGAVRKGGGLTKRATERAAALFPALAAAGDRLTVLARALAAGGVLSVDGEERAIGRAAFTALLRRWGQDLPFFLSAALAAGEAESLEQRRLTSEGEATAPVESPGRAGAEAAATLIASALRDPGPASAPGAHMVFLRPGLVRWLKIAAHRAGLSLDASRCVGALEELGIIASRGGGLSLALRSASPSQASSSARLVAEGSHALHLLPEASLEERLFVGSVARPRSLATVWSFEIERDCVRRAFASGLGARDISARLQTMTGGLLPQSLSFSLDAWEEEYRALRLYRGVVLVAEERFRAVVERSTVLGDIVAEVLAPGVYFLSAPSSEAAVEALARVGLEASPRIAASPRGAVAHRVSGYAAELSVGGAGELFADAASPRLEQIEELRARLSGRQRDGAATLDPAPRLGELRRALEEALRAGARTAEEGRELADRIERRLVLTERQISEAEARPERLEAGGLDYLGKVRVIERALRSPGDRLEVLYRLPGAEPVRAVLRPVKLDRNEKGLVLEAEDLATGGPARVPLGAVSTVRRVRASLFGEDT